MSPSSLKQDDLHAAEHGRLLLARPQSRELLFEGIEVAFVDLITPSCLGLLTSARWTGQRTEQARGSRALPRWLRSRASSKDARVCACTLGFLPTPSTRRTLWRPQGSTTKCLRRARFIIVDSFESIGKDIFFLFYFRRPPKYVRISLYHICDESDVINSTISMISPWTTSPQPNSEFARVSSTFSAPVIESGVRRRRLPMRLGPSSARGSGTYRPARRVAH